MNLRRHSVLAPLVLLALLTGCTAAEAPAPEPSSGPVITPSEIPAVAPTFAPDGTAEENRDYFDYVISQHIADGGVLNRESFTLVLTAAGWAAERIETTPDASPLGNPADTMTFAVSMGEDCLIGQWNGAYSSAITALLATGTCLVGSR